MRLHPNIRVIRHPNHVSINPYESALYWSHHEKMVVVDQAIAIIGGMDLCPGRFDTPDHVLHDRSDDVVPKVDYYNPKAQKQLVKAYVAKWCRVHVKPCLLWPIVRRVGLSPTDPYLRTIMLCAGCHRACRS